MRAIAKMVKCWSPLPAFEKARCGVHARQFLRDCGSDELDELIEASARPISVPTQGR